MSAEQYQNLLILNETLCREYAEETDEKKLSGLKKLIALSEEMLLQAEVE
jgi:hypothetical protein